MQIIQGYKLEVSFFVTLKKGQNEIEIFKMTEQEFKHWVASSIGIEGRPILLEVQRVESRVKK